MEASVIAKATKVAVARTEFGHVVEIHAVPGADKHQRGRDNRDEGEQFDDLSGLMARHVDIDLEDVREGIGVGLRPFPDVEQGVIDVAVIRNQMGRGRSRSRPGRTARGPRAGDR